MARGTRIFLISAIVISASTGALLWRITSNLPSEQQSEQGVVQSPPQQPAQPIDPHRQAALDTAKTLLAAESVFDRFLAAGTLFEAGDRTGYDMLVEGLVSPDPTVARAAMDTMLSVPDFCGLAQTVADMDGRPVLGEALLRGIAYFSRLDALPYVRESLNSPISTVRIGALRTIARLNDVKSLSHVQNLLDAGGMMDDERANAYYTLSVLGDGVSLQDDIIVLTQNSETSVREIAAIALGNIQSEKSRQALAVLVEDQSARVRIAALGSHINVGSKASIEALEYVITTGRRDNAMVAAAALKRVPASIAEGVIKRVIECCEPKIEVALRLMETWGRIGGAVTDNSIPAWGLGNDDPDVRLQTLWALGWRADRATRDLIFPYLKDPDPAMRGMSAWAVARIGVPVPDMIAPDSSKETPVCPVNYHDRNGDEEVKEATNASVLLDRNRG